MVVQGGKYIQDKLIKFPTSQNKFAKLKVEGNTPSIVFS